MYTVEHEHNVSIVTSLDQEDMFEDVEFIVGTDESVVYIRQYDESMNEDQIVFMSIQQWQDIMAAWNSPEGAFYLKLKMEERNNGTSST